MCTWLYVYVLHFIFCLHLQSSQLLRWYSLSDKLVNEYKALLE